ncbi:MAG: hypothetical protein U0172_07775 [Nitrospiraceae bacterium]
MIDRTPPSSPGHPLAALLTPTLGAEQASRLAVEFVASKQADRIAELLDELTEVSPKVVRATVEALPEWIAKAGAADTTAWLDLIIAVATASSATALKCVKESPWLIGMIDPPTRRAEFLQYALEVADHDANLAMEWVRVSPELARLTAVSDWAPWIELGVELTERDYVLGPELFRDLASIVEAVPLSDARAWINFGLQLVTTNQFGKTDYYATIEYLRSSPALLRTMADEEARRLTIRLAAAVALLDRQVAIELLAQAPGWLSGVAEAGWQRRMLQYGLLLAERDAISTREYLRRCPEFTRWQGYDEAARRAFEAWYAQGMEILSYSAEGARAYFAMETQGAQTAVQEAQSGVVFRRVARSVKLFVRALCGRDVRIDALSDAEAASSTARARVSRDGRTILFPALLRRYPDAEQNARLYHVMAAHEAGHLEFGTYDLPLQELGALRRSVAERYHKANATTTEPPALTSLADLFALYPQPGVVRDLWTILEDTRVEAHLRRLYPGLARDLSDVTREAVTTRSLSQGMSVREMLLDGLLIRSAEIEQVQMPDAIRGPLDQAWAACAPVLAPTASAVDAVHTADVVYQLFDQLVATYQAPPDARDSGAVQDQQEQTLVQGTAAADLLATEYRSLDNWSFRGAMDPAQVGTSESNAAGVQPAVDRPEDLRDAGAAQGRGRQSGQTADAFGEQQSATQPSGQESAPDGGASEPTDQMDRRRALWDAGRDTGVEHRYDEWDGMLRDYRTRWCRVVEDRTVPQRLDVAESLLTPYRPIVQQLRRLFEGLRAPAFRQVRGVTDGDEIDLDAVVSRRADVAAGVEPTDRVYARRERRERDVAAALLVDLSGSTSRRIGADHRRVIDVEKTGLLLFVEALEALGDQYAIYGFSGKGRKQVDITVVKEFAQSGRAAATACAGRIGALEPRAQNRDGAAVRHITRKLMATGARVKLLILLSDGRPLDDAYAEDYAAEDTKMALREAKAVGVEPFCITVNADDEAAVRRMYGDVRYLVIDRIEGLPERLPRVYHRLTT